MLEDTGCGPGILYSRVWKKMYNKHRNYLWLDLSCFIPFKPFPISLPLFFLPVLQAVSFRYSQCFFRLTNVRGEKLSLSLSKNSWLGFDGFKIKINCNCALEVQWGNFRCVKSIAEWGSLSFKDADNNALFVMLVACVFLGQDIHQDPEIFMPFFTLLKEQKT